MKIDLSSWQPAALMNIYTGYFFTRAMHVKSLVVGLLAFTSLKNKIQAKTLTTCNVHMFIWPINPNAYCQLGDHDRWIGSLVLITLIYLCVSMCGGLRTTYESQFCLSSMWILGIENRLSGLVASTFTGCNSCPGLRLLYHTVLHRNYQCHGGKIACYLEKYKRSCKK